MLRTGPIVNAYYKKTLWVRLHPMTRPGAALSAIVSLALATLETARRAAQADAIAALRVE